MLNEVRENAFINNLIKAFAHAPVQINLPHQSDAELIRLPDSHTILAVTTDHLVEEISTGLYTDPHLIGWMAVTINASDLAAVGAEPLGMLLAETLPPDCQESFIEALLAGIQEASEDYGLPILGGDTNFSPHWQMGGCALGLIPEGNPMTRMGCRPGDLLFSSGILGSGSAFAFGQLAGSGESSRMQSMFRPVARLKEGRLLRGFTSCCMDTSDGALATLDQLARLNLVGFTLDADLMQVLTREAAELATSQDLPPWMMLAGIHGEFELLFTVPAAKLDDFLRAATEQSWHPVELGRVTAEVGVRLASQGKTTVLETGKIRNVFSQLHSNIHDYIRELFRLGYTREG